MNSCQNTKWRWITPSLVIVFFVILSLLRHWEIGGESWGYWYFSRVLVETGEFVIPDRSPLYTVYLTLFRWLGYPISVTLEYVVTTSFAALSLFFFSKYYLRIPLATIATLLWIPFLYSAEPPVQALALGCCCLAMVARRKWAGRKGKSVSYALFGVAYLFRGVYLLFLLAFIAWDFIEVIRKRGWKSLGSSVRPHLYNLPLLIVIMLPILFMVNQSSHPWNTVTFASAKYYPTGGKSLVNASFIQSFNMEYAEITYGVNHGKDFYFTNQELFNGASTALEAIKENPEFIVKQWGQRVKDLIGQTFNMTSIPMLRSAAFGFIPYGGVGAIFAALILLIIGTYGVIKQSINKKEWIFILSCMMAVTLVIIINMPQQRKMVPLIPALIVGASWLCDMMDKYLKVGGAKLRNLFSHSKQKLDRIYILFRVPFWRGFIIGLIILVLFSIGLGDWADFGKNLVLDVKQGDISILARRSAPGSFVKQSFSEIESIIADCRGVMVIESTFFGAFSNLPREKIYDVWEIPPFGRFNESEYNGLRPERIDCLLISKKLQTLSGIRYQNYIEPYMHELLRMGASSIEIPGYGKAVILKSSKN